jgi:hypothetical protein
VRFSDCPAFDLPSSGAIQDHFWESDAIIGINDDWEFVVYLSSEQPTGQEQQSIEISRASKPADNPGQMGPRDSKSFEVTV